MVPLVLPMVTGPISPVSVPVDGVIMVAGATGGVGKRVVVRLLAAGKHVRALVRDLEKGKAMLVSHRNPGVGWGVRVVGCGHAHVCVCAPVLCVWGRGHDGQRQDMTPAAHCAVSVGELPGWTCGRPVGPYPAMQCTARPPPRMAR